MQISSWCLFVSIERNINFIKCQIKLLFFQIFCIDPYTTFLQSLKIPYLHNSHEQNKNTVSCSICHTAKCKIMYVHYAKLSVLEAILLKWNNYLFLTFILFSLLLQILRGTVNYINIKLLCYLTGIYGNIILIYVTTVRETRWKINLPFWKDLFIILKIVKHDLLFMFYFCSYLVLVTYK